MKKIIIFIFFLILLMPNMGFAGQTSKVSSNTYQAVKLSENAVFILDKNEWHIWIWVTQVHKGKSAEFLSYQGKLVAGSKMGDVIQTTYKGPLHPEGE